MAIRNSSQTPKSSPADWTRSFRLENSRRSSGLTIWTLTACALLLPVAFAHRTEAETPPVVLPALAPAPSVSPAKTPAVSSPARPDLAVAKSALAPLTAVIAGQTQKAHILPTEKMTVGEALSAMGVTVNPLDRVAPEASESFAPGMTIRVTRVTIETVTSRQPIDAEVRYKPTTSLSPGTSQTTQYPRAGSKEIVEKVYTKDGEETLRKTISTKVAREPQNRVISLGVSSRFMPRSIKPHPRYKNALSYRGGGPRNRALAARAAGETPEFHIAKTLKMETSAYQGAEVGGGGMRTATGMRVGYGAIAVDPRVIPLGSKLYVEGYGYGFACDTGGAIKGRRIDLAFPTISQCNRYGRKHGVTVHVLSE